MKMFKTWATTIFLFLSAGCGAAEKFQTIQIEITSYLGDKQVFQQGDPLKFLISLDRNAYLYVFYQTADNQLIQLIPNQNKKNNFYKADIFIEVPDKSSSYQFSVSPPFGHETVYGIAIDKPLKFEGETLSNGLKRMKLPINIIKKRVLDAVPEYYGVSDFSLITRKGSSQ